MARLFKGSCVALGALGLLAQDPQALLQGIKATGTAAPTAMGGVGATDPFAAKVVNPAATETAGAAAQNLAEDQKLAEEIRKLKGQEKGPRRFAADLFDVRQMGSYGTDGGVSDDYVLGTGDLLNISAFGSATFEAPVKVDGRGMLILPKVGSVKVGGLTLGRAKEAVHALVGRQFSNTSLDIQPVKLREVRVLVAGEVYKPGSYLVSSLSSLVNVLSLAGGPTAAGSFRQIRVLRGGKAVHTLDLYPLRAEGLGNANFYLSNGDTVFVPLAANIITLEGAFTRVVAAAQREIEAKEAKKSKDATQLEETAGQSTEERQMRTRIRQIEEQLKAKSAPAAGRSGVAMGSEWVGGETPAPVAPDAKDAKLPDAATLQAQLDALQTELRNLRSAARLDQRIDNPDAPIDEFQGKPQWLVRWQVDGVTPRMRFEMLPGETAADALRFAGGVDVGGASDRLSLRHLDASGAWTSVDVPLGTGTNVPLLQKGDILSALPLRERMARIVEVGGWVRAGGDFARTEGLRIGDLLKRDSQILPDTYLSRGEISRTLPDGTKRFLAFDVTKALNGDATENIVLEDRDRVQLFRVGDLRLRKIVKVVGPVQRPGNYDFAEGMRASDLLFRAGLPLRSADSVVAELTHVRGNHEAQVLRLDLSKLLSTENGSPVSLKDDAVNPLVEPFDQLSIYAKPDYRPIRTITLSGEVKRPGVYTLDSTSTSLREIVERAGGLTSEAMPRAAVFLRKMGTVDPEREKAALLSGVASDDPTSNGINETLNRLKETKRDPKTSLTLNNPLLHGLETGSLSRLVVDIPGLLAGKSGELELKDGDTVVFPTKTSTVYVIGETASPFAAYMVQKGMTVDDLVNRAGGYTRNADKGSVRLLKADGRIVDSWVSRQKVEPGDAVLVPQRIRRDSSWQENLQALTPLAILINTFK